MSQLIDHVIPQVVRVRRGQIGQPAVLAPAPHQFVRIDLGRVGRQRRGDNFGMLSQESTHKPRPAMKVAAIPNHGVPILQLTFSCSRKSTTSWAVMLVLSGNRSKIRLGRLDRGLTVRPLIAEMRSRRSPQSRNGLLPRGAQGRTTVGARTETGLWKKSKEGPHACARAA